MNGYQWLVATEFALAAVTFVALLRLTAPYGRHVRGGWGPTVPNRWGWILMEAPAVLVFLAVYLQGAQRGALVPLLLLGLWQVHYVHRTFIFPFRLKSSKPMPLLIPLTAIAFNTLNGYVNARWISHLGEYTSAWLLDPRFLIGVGVFLVGMAINLHSDTVLLRLRGPGESGYKIPQGGMYRFVSCPNYLGEMLEWIGWAIATWSLAGTAFAVYTAANLIPRALENHRWYLEKFPDYPARKAVVPGLL